MDGLKTLKDLEAQGFALPFDNKKVSRIECEAFEYKEGEVRYSSRIYFSQEYRHNVCHNGSSDMRFEGKSFLEVLKKAEVFLSLL